MDRGEKIVSKGLETIANPEARQFAELFLTKREVNEDFYKLVPENKLDFRMVDNVDVKSDSPRESLKHQIDITLNYIQGVKTGVLQFGSTIKDQEEQEPEVKTKEQLLQALEQSKEQLVAVLSDSDISSKKVKVPWSANEIPAIASLYGLSDHEVLHTGWNMAMMDHLGIKRYPSLIRNWGT